MFQVFGAGHVLALALTAAAAGAAVYLGRAWRGSPREDLVSGTLFGLLATCLLVDPFHHAALGDAVLQKGLPLEFCDAAGIATLVALLRRRPLAFELAYLWGLSGTLQAILTPSVEYGFGHPDTLRYFLLHSGIVVAVLYLGPGLGMRTRPGAVRRVFGWAAVYAAGVGLVDWIAGANYMFLREKPPGSILDPFGPWPWYIAGGAVVAWVLFWLIDLPFRLLR